MGGDRAWDVDALLAAIPARLFDEWMAFYSLDPWGEQRADLRAAFLTSMVANYMRGKEQMPYELHDFMPYSDKPAPPSPEDVGARLLAKFGLTADGSPLSVAVQPDHRPAAAIKG